DLYHEVISLTLRIFLCGDPDDCSKFCGSPDCFTLGTAISTIANMMLEFISIVLPKITEFCNTILRFAGSLLGGNSLLKILVQLASNTQTALQVLKALFANFILAPIDLAICSV